MSPVFFRAVQSIFADRLRALFGTRRRRDTTEPRPGQAGGQLSGSGQFWDGDLLFSGLRTINFPLFSTRCNLESSVWSYRFLAIPAVAQS